MQFYGYHGLFTEEKKLGQRFFVDLELYTHLSKAGETDNMHDSINYGDVFEQVKEIVTGNSYNLIEALAKEITDNLFMSFPLLNAITIKVVKPDPPINGQLDSVAVEIYRKREDGDV